MVSDTFHFALICTFIAIKIVSPLRGLKLDNAEIFLLRRFTHLFVAHHNL